MEKKMKKLPIEKSKKHYKIRYLNVFCIFLLFGFFSYFLVKLYQLPIKNIYIQNNTYLKDQEIIEIAGISDYPSTLKNSSKTLEERLLKSPYILSVDVSKNHLSEVVIDVLENVPLFYNRVSNKTVYENGYEDSRNYFLPTLVNYVPDTIYEQFIKKMRLVDRDVLMRISEIEYNPNEVDDMRFLLTMKDQNYVYLTLYKFENINSYVEVIKRFSDKKGILYLDSGEYFKVYE